MLDPTLLMRPTSTQIIYQWLPGAIHGEFYLEAERHHYLPSTRLKLLINQDGIHSQEIFRLRPFTPEEQMLHRRRGTLEEVTVNAILTIEQNGQSSRQGITVLDILTGYFVDGHYVHGFTDKSIATDLSAESRRILEASYMPRDLLSADKFIDEATQLLRHPTALAPARVFRGRLRDFILKSNLDESHKNAVRALLE